MGIIIAIIVCCLFAIGYLDRKDVVFAILGYITAAIAIITGIFFGCLYLYTKFVVDLWNQSSL